jgi:hypothetical protein
MKNHIPKTRVVYPYIIVRTGCEHRTLASKNILKTRTVAVTVGQAVNTGPLPRKTY